MGAGCDGVRPELVAYLDGELDAGARAKVEAHLAECAACRRERALLARTADLLAALPGGEPPAGFEDRLAARLGRGRARLWRAALGLAAAAAAVVAAILGLPLLRPAPGSGDLLDPRPPEVARLDPAAEEQIIASLDLLEALEVVESIELLGDEDGIVDPFFGLPGPDEEENG